MKTPVIKLQASVLVVLLILVLTVDSFRVQPLYYHQPSSIGMLKVKVHWKFSSFSQRNPIPLNALEKFVDDNPTLFSSNSGDGAGLLQSPSSSVIKSSMDNQDSQISLGDEMGEDAALFKWSDQSSSKWIQFGIAVSSVLAIVNQCWISPTGLRWGDKYKSWLEYMAGGNSTWTIVYMLGLFSICHSGLASLRPFAESFLGPRIFRYIFAFISLPLAFSSIVYFINHRNEGQKLWDIKDVPGTRLLVFIASLVSFLFLYPSSFNLLEIAAVEEPTLHLWTTGIMRITRHPQFIGQCIWCIAHTAYVGTSFMLAASIMLCAHHMFAVWNGDRRLKAKFGKKVKAFMDQTSIIPFAAILSGKQKLPKNYLSEFLRVPYATIVSAVFGSYFAHKAMIEGSASLKCHSVIFIVSRLECL